MPAIALRGSRYRPTRYPLSSYRGCCAGRGAESGYGGARARAPLLGAREAQQEGQARRPGALSLSLSCFLLSYEKMPSSSSSPHLLFPSFPPRDPSLSLFHLPLLPLHLHSIPLPPSQSPHVDVLFRARRGEELTRRCDSECRSRAAWTACRSASTRPSTRWPARPRYESRPQSIGRCWECLIHSPLSPLCAYTWSDAHAITCITRELLAGPAHGIETSRDMRPVLACILVPKGHHRAR